MALCGSLSRLLAGPQAALLVPRRLTSSVAALRTVLNGELDAIRSAGTWKEERVITTRQAATIRVKDSSEDILNFCANNYLGLSVSYSLYTESVRILILVGGAVMQTVTSVTSGRVCMYISRYTRKYKRTGGFSVCWYSLKQCLCALFIDWLASHQ